MREWAAAACLALAAGAGAAEEAAAPVVVLELFTSQGCSSCPPADALLAELATRPGVIALAMHVDYWNYLGWRDTFSLPAATARQKDYARAFGDRMIYTPQLVVNGAEGVVGSRRDKVEQALERAAPLTVAVTLVPQGDMLRATAAAVAGVAGDVVYVVYDDATTVEVTEGENRGRAVATVNPVRLVTTLDSFSGGEGAWTVPAPTDARGVVVMIQSADDRRVLGAAAYDMAAR